MRLAKRLILTAAVAVLGGTAWGQRPAVQWKANAQAAAGRCFHPGGGFVAGASYEGVGFSTVSPQHALAMCCYSQSGLPVVAQAVSAGPTGYYAVKQYAPGPVRQVVGSGLVTTGQVVANVGAAMQAPVVHRTVYSATPGMPEVATTGTPTISLGGNLLPTCPGGRCGK